MKILLSSIGVQSGTDLQLALYYLKSYLLKHPSAPIRHSEEPFDFAQGKLSAICEANRRTTEESQQSFDVRIKVFHEEDKVSVISRKILNLNPRLIGFSCYIWNIEKILKACRGIKKANPRIKIVLGGPEVSPRAEEILAREKSVDIVARGEGETTFAELARNFMGDISGISGISFRDGKRVISNPGRPRIRNLEEIPSPYLSGVIGLKDKNIVDLPLETARGCAFRCGYCYYHKNSPQVRYFPLARVEKELKLILSAQPKEVYLMDATFNSNPRRAKKILRFFIKYNRNSSLHLELKAELIDEEFARLLRKANCLNIEIGIQSTNAKTLKAVNRRFNRKKFQRGIRLLNKYKLFYEIQLIDALPLQSYADLKNSLDWLYALCPARVVIFRLAVLPGTALRRDAGRYGIIYDKRAPYYAVKSDAMDRKDVSRAAKLSFAMERLYDSHIFQETLYGLKSKGGMRISEVFEDWVSWEARFKRRPCDYPFFLNKKSPEFLEYTCRKRNKVSLGKKLMPALKATLAEYQKAYYS